MTYCVALAVVLSHFFLFQLNVKLVEVVYGIVLVRKAGDSHIHRETHYRCRRKVKLTFKPSRIFYHLKSFIIEVHAGCFQLAGGLVEGHHVSNLEIKQFRQIKLDQLYQVFVCLYVCGFLDKVDYTLAGLPFLRYQLVRQVNFESRSSKQANNLRYHQIICIPAS